MPRAPPRTCRAQHPSRQTLDSSSRFGLVCAASALIRSPWVTRRSAKRLLLSCRLGDVSGVVGLDLNGLCSIGGAFPPTGSVISYQDLTGQRMAGFSIDASGTGTTLYAIKVEEWNTQRPVLMTFVSGGSLDKLEVPLGIYRIKIASGDTWYGLDDLFGPGTRVQTAEKPLHFYAEGSTITGHTLILQSVGGGDRFPTAEAARREF